MEQTDIRRPELDVLRGFAVLGIFLVNIIFFGWPYDANLYPTLFGGLHGLNVLSWGFVHLLVEGAMFALFSMLFGASALMLLGTERLSGADGVRAVDFFYRRNLWLIVFGLLHAFFLLWPLEILFTYGVLGLALFPLRNLRPTTLLVAGVLMVTWGTAPLDPFPADTPTVSAVVSEQQPVERRPLSEGELLQALDQEIETMAAEMALYHSDYASIFWDSVDVAVGQQTANLYEDNIWDAGGMMLVGMALFKWGILTGQRSLAFYLIMTVAGFALAVFLRLPGVSAGIVSGFDPDQVRHVASVPSLLGRLPLALGYVGLIMLLCRWDWLRGLSRALGATGRMAFTHYVGQTVFAILLFYGFGFGLFARFAYFELILIALAFGGVQVLISVFWLRYFRQGPLEWLWRSLVRWRLQPFLRRAPQTVPAANAAGPLAPPAAKETLV